MDTFSSGPMEMPGASWRSRRRPATTRAGGQDRPARQSTATLALDGEGVILRVAPSFGAAVGYEPETLVRTFFFSYVHGRDLAPILQDVAALVHGKKETARWSFRFRRADGSWVRLLADVESRLGTPSDEVILTVSESHRSGAT